MSRKFIVAIVGLLVAIVGVIYGNYIAIICGCFLGASFIIGESIVDKAASVHRSIDVTDYKQYNIDAKVEKANASKDKA